MKQPTPITAQVLSEEQAVARVLGRDVEYAAITEVATRTGVTRSELLRHIVREFYNVQFDVKAPELRSAFGRSKRDAAKWGAQTQA